MADFAKENQFTPDQQAEIDAGIKDNIDVSIYAKPEFLAIQMHEIRIGLVEQIPVSYSAIRYHIVWFQIDFPGRDGSRLTRHPDRYHRRNGDHLWRCTDREMDENGKRDYFTHFGR